MKRTFLYSVFFIIICILLCSCRQQEKVANNIPIAEGPIRKSNVSVPGIPSSEPNIKGRIIRLDRTSSAFGIFQIVVKADPESFNSPIEPGAEPGIDTIEEKYDLVRINIEEHTFLGDASGVTVAPSSFFIGSEVEVWYSGEPTMVADIVQFEGQAVKVLSRDSEIYVPELEGSFPWMAATSGGNSILSVIYVSENSDTYYRNFGALTNRPGSPVLNATSSGSVSLKFNLPPEGTYSVTYATNPSEEFIPIEASDNTVFFRDLSIDIDSSDKPVMVYFLIDAFYTKDETARSVKYFFAVQVSMEESPVVM